MKIELFSKMVREKALTEPKRVLDALNKRHAQILDDMETACEAARVTHLEGVYRKHYDKQRRAIAKAHSDAQSRVLRKRSELLESLRDGLRLEVKGLLDSPEYVVRFTRQLDEAIGSMGDADALLVVMRSGDAEKLPDWVKTKVMVKTKVDDALLGGFYIIKDGVEKYDFTIDRALDEMDAFLGCMMNTLYEITGEGCDDYDDDEI